MVLLLLCLGFLAVILLPLVITLAEEVSTRWRYRHITGPPQSWLTGNITELRRGGLLPTVGRWISQYGKIYKLRIMGRTFVVISDPDAVRTLMYKVTNHAPIANPNSKLMTGGLRAVELYGLVSAMDDFWRTVRTAWQPAFAPASLRGYQALMDREALAAVRRLDTKIQSGGTGGDNGLVEMLGEMSRTTLAVVGTAAYGVDFASPEYGGSGAAIGSAATATATTPLGRGHGRGGGELSLVQACSDWFRSMGPSYSSSWALATAFPRFLPLLRHLACAFPDAALATHIRARRVVCSTAQRLIDNWRHHHKAHEATNGTANGTTNGTAVGTGVAPGSFLGLMLAARDKSCGRGLSDVQLSAQVQTFMLAGFETTANALTFAVYHLALHPDKAAALREELDAHLPPPLTPPSQSPGQEEGGGAAVPAPLTGEVLEKLLYTEAVIQEAMRLHPPAHSVSRFSHKPMKVLGHDLPAGTAFFIPISHLQRAQELWPDAEAFRPERFLAPGSGQAVAAGGGAEGGLEEGAGRQSDNGGGSAFGSLQAGGDTALGPRHPHVYIPFGAGSRMCVGWRFAMQEAKTVLARLFQHFEFELAPGQVPLELSAGLTLAPKHGVLVRVTRRGV